MYMKVGLLALLLASVGSATAQKQNKLNSFVEYGATVRTGDNTPLWQVSNLQGLASLDNSTYIRGGVFYNDRWGKWDVEAGLDVIAAAGFSSGIQQAYADFRYKWFGIFAGSKEMTAPLINSRLSSGELTWSGNSRPIPQIMIGIPEYLYLLPRLAIKGEISYGWFTDSNWLKDHANVAGGAWYTKNIKYHHKEGFVRIGVPDGKWQLDFGMTLDTEFGGQRVTSSGEVDLGNTLKDYFRIFIPGSADEDKPANDALFYQGNFVGTEQIRGTYRGKDFSISAYLDNYFEDFSAMGKQNGWDGLWGIELKFNTSVRSTMLYWSFCRPPTKVVRSMDFTNLRTDLYIRREVVTTITTTACTMDGLIGEWPTAIPCFVRPFTMKMGACRSSTIA